MHVNVILGYSCKFNTQKIKVLYIDANGIKPQLCH